MALYPNTPKPYKNQQDIEIRTHLICICICFRYVCRLTITNNRFHKGGRAAEGGAPTFVEVAAKRPPLLLVMVRRQT